MDKAKIEEELSRCAASLAQAKEELRKNEEKYRALVEDANSIILRMDPKGNIIFFNEFAQNFFGYKEDEILGKNVNGTIVPAASSFGQDLKAMISDIMLNPQKYINNENENILRNGKRVWISWTNRPILDQGKNLKEVLCIGNDITKLKQATQQKFESVIENLSEGIISCDLDWKIKYANISARKYLGIDQAGKGNLAEIIFNNYTVSIDKEEFFDFSVAHKEFDITRSESKEFKALYLEADLNILKDSRGDAENIIMLFRDVTQIRKEEKKVEINLDCPQKNTILHISPKHLELIIFNLIDNAVKFNDKEAVKISIGVSVSAEKIGLSVADNGRGIPPEEYDNIFEKFYQIEKYFTGNISGAGLGLPLVKRLISGYGGSIRLESELGTGSKFTISLPIEKMH